MAVAALLIWLGTAAVGSYLLITAISAGNAARRPRRPAEAVAAASPLAPVRPRDRWDPPSLQRAKHEELPGVRDLAEFAHPALAVTGLGFWLGYVVSRDRLFAAIGLGILLGTIAAGVSWYAVNRRKGKRADPDGGDTPQRSAPLLASPRLLLLHGAGAALTVLLVALIVAGV